MSLVFALIGGILQIFAARVEPGKIWYRDIMTNSLEEGGGEGGGGVARKKNLLLSGPGA